MMRIAVLLFTATIGLGACAIDPAEENADENIVEQEIVGPPTNVQITAIAADRVNLGWDAVTGAVKYYVYQATNSAGPYSFANTARAPATSIQIAHLTPGVNYCFIIATDDGTGAGAASPPACTSTSTGAQAPATVIAAPYDPTTVLVKWSSVNEAAKYYVYRSGAINGTYSYLTTVFAPTLQYSNAGLLANTTYCYKVASDVGGLISSLSVGHCNTSFQPPATVSATRTSPTRINVAWSTVSGATKYFVYESKNGGAFANVTSVAQSGAPSVIRANLTTGAQYCYRIQSVNAANQVSPASLQPVCATP